MKFQVGDTVKHKDADMVDEIYKVIKIAEKGDIVKGPWWAGNEENKMTANSYILEDEDGKWFWEYIGWENDYELEDKQTIKMIQIDEKSLKDLLKHLEQTQEYIYKALGV
jgi:hypothetical protein